MPPATLQRRRLDSRQASPWRKTASSQLPPDPVSARIARRFTRETLSGLPHTLVETAELLATELVGNAIRHGRSSPTLTIDIADGQVRVSVTDSSAQAPQVRDTSPESESGRGLFLVESLAQDWGWSPAGTGKRVWCTLVA